MVTTHSADSTTLTGPVLQLIVQTYFGRRLKIRVPGLYPWTTIDTPTREQKTTK